MNIKIPTQLLGLLMMTVSPLTMAHTYSSFIGSTPTSKAVLQTTCYDDGNGPPAALIVGLQSVSKPKYLLKLTATTGSFSGTTNDPINGDRASGPLATVSDGGDDGSVSTATFTITIEKTKKKPNAADSTLNGKDVFSLTFHCWSTTNQHTGTTDIYRLQ